MIPILSAALAAQPSRVVRVGSFPYAEQLKRDPNGNYSGYGFEYLMEIAKYTGWQYEFVDASWQDCLAMLEHGEIDLMGAVLSSPRRQAVYGFSDFPMISGYGVLATTRSNAELPYEDFQAFEGLCVGVLLGNQQSAQFLAYAGEHGFTPSLRYYSTEPEMEAALHAGELDAMILTSILRSQQYRIIAKFGENESYFATRKDDAELLRQLNTAMDHIRLNNPYFNSELNEKYYHLQAATPVSFTREELEFIQSSPPLRCLYPSDLRPVSYTDHEGRFRGIAADVCALLEETTGLRFAFQPSENHFNQSDFSFPSDTDLLLCHRYDLNWALQNRASLSEVYLTGQTVMVTNGQAGEAPVLALCELFTPNQPYFAGMPLAKEIKMYPTIAQCLNALNSGEADTTLINSVIMSYYSNNPRYAKLTTMPLYGFSDDMCIGVSPEANPLLLSVLNKGLGNISATGLNHIIAENTKADPMNDLPGLIYEHPIQSVLLVGGSLLAFSLVLTLLLRDRANTARAMHDMLYTDSLTGHPNYKALSSDAPALLGRASEPYALIYMDMHRFKSVNDVYGYEAGDHVLRAIADTLDRFIRKGERFARVYADTFVLLLHYADDDALSQRVKELSDALASITPPGFEGNEFLFSGGIYRLQKQSRNLDHACDRANYAKSSIPEFYSNTFVFYDDVLHSRIMEEKELERSMLPALERNEFVPFYQPKVNAVTGEVVGAEALVRWRHPQLGCLSPASFLPFYEQNGFVVKIDLSIFEQVCDYLQNSLRNGKRTVPISVNFSRRHMQNKHFGQTLREIADRHGVPPELLEIEITETGKLDSVDLAAEFVQSIKECGFLVSIDDYGVGYSSISFLQELPLDILKLDKKFIENAMAIPKACDLMQHLTLAMRKNGIQIVCEGIETPKQRDFIIDLDCNIAQGYLYAKPMPLQQFEEFLEEHKEGAVG